MPNRPQFVLLGEKAFGPNDQHRFARLSSDCNPMHLDPIAARRVMTGRPVVHGIHVLMAAIELWRNDADAHPVSIRCSFDNPVSVDDIVVFTQRAGDANDDVIEAAVNGLPCSRIVISTTRPAAQSRADSGSTEDEATRETCRVDGLVSPLDQAAESHLHKKYAVTPNGAGVTEEFPHSCRYLGKDRVAAIVALSYVVGMVCPGLHSIFSSLSLEVVSNSPDVGAELAPPKGRPRSAPTSGVLTFSVRKYDARFRLFDIAFQGAIHGSLKAFLRPPPQRQPSLKEVAAQVRPDEFRGTRSLVIGGSRGLGEVTAKILGAGGGHVVITYASGVEDAQRVRDEIKNGGLGDCEILKLDFATDSYDAMPIDRGPLNAVYFFATPRIFRKQPEVFEPRLFQEFSDFYVTKLYELCVYLEAGTAVRPTQVYFPSSVAVSARPRGMTEYAMAKSAAEVLIEDINASFKHVSVFTTRLPRLNTDQTSSILSVETASNLETLLPIVRSLNR